MTDWWLLVLPAVVIVGGAFWVIGRRTRRREAERPNPANNWQNEQYTEFEKGGKLRSESVAPLDDGRTSF